MSIFGPGKTIKESGESMDLEERLFNSLRSLKQIISIERQKVYELEQVVSAERQKVLDLELEQRKAGKRYRGECSELDKAFGAWTKLAAIEFGFNRDHFSSRGELTLTLGNNNILPQKYRVFTRIRYNGAVQHFKTNERSTVYISTLNRFDGTVEVLAFIQFLPNGLTFESPPDPFHYNDLFIESWISLEYENSGYDLELTFDGRFEQITKCHYYNINYFEH